MLPVKAVIALASRSSGLADIVFLVSALSQDFDISPQ
jgi:hypothetical protein